jgi:hypothetical protein
VELGHRISSSRHLRTGIYDLEVRPGGTGLSAGAHAILVRVSGPEGAGAASAIISIELPEHRGGDARRPP